MKRQPVKNNNIGNSGKGVRGEAHHDAKRTDAEIEMLRATHQQYPVGDPRHVGYRRLAKIYKLGKSTVRKICNYTTRLPKLK